MFPIGILIMSHNKPGLVDQALCSVLMQTYTDWTAVLIDSGVLYDQGYFNRYKHPRLKILRSVETEEIRKTCTMSCWITNYAFNNNLIDSDLIMTLCDDDILYPNAFYAFVKKRKTSNARAMYASQDVATIDQNGNLTLVGERLALEIKGSKFGGGRLDCVVDYLQFCHTKDLLDEFKTKFNTNKFMEENKAHNHHADGLFMEAISSITPVYPINEKVSQNRRTPESVNLRQFSPKKTPKFKTKII
jgi:glycosyltransferase involved in cell wall biosynthesis